MAAQKYYKRGVVKAEQFDGSEDGVLAALATLGDWRVWEDSKSESFVVLTDAKFRKKCLKDGLTPLPVIPQAVRDAIRIHKKYAHSLLDIFGVLSIYGVSRAEPAQDYNAWIVHHPDAFALAWLMDDWEEEETGE